VWGPTGGPGRTTVAVNLAFEAAAIGGEVLLVDADTYGGAVATPTFKKTIGTWTHGGSLDPERSAGTGATNLMIVAYRHYRTLLLPATLTLAVASSNSVLRYTAAPQRRGVHVGRRCMSRQPGVRFVCYWASEDFGLTDLFG
jgi:hypothetical protein